MSILIKGMEMPRGCNTCQFRDLCFDYYVCRAKKLEDRCYLDVDDVVGRRHRCCPLVEIPTPHGRLIDFKEEIESIYGDALWLKTYFEFLDEVPTIIEAEVGKQ